MIKLVVICLIAVVGAFAQDPLVTEEVRCMLYVSNNNNN